MTDSIDKRLGQPKSIAIVSGKGGSGKTLVATAMAQELAANGVKVLLVDADLGTGGLTYYLGYSAYRKTRVGLVEFLLRTVEASPQKHVSLAQPNAAGGNAPSELISFLPVGEHRILGGRAFVTSAAVGDLLSLVEKESQVVIFDCRGGIDDESIAICRAVDEVLLVVETDAAAIGSSTHLVEILSREGLGEKIGGFILNKVMDDPSSLAKTGATLFRADYLGAVPFDIETTRSFIKGELPSLGSLFQRHVGAVTQEVFHSLTQKRFRALLDPAEFGTTTLRKPAVALANAILLFSALLLFLAYSLQLVISGRSLDSIFMDRGSIFFFSMWVIAVFASSDGLKSVLGDVIRSYARAIQHIAALTVGKGR